MAENTTFEEIRAKARQEKLGRITSWLFQTEDSETHSIVLGKILTDGALSENVRRFFLFFLAQEPEVLQKNRTSITTELEDKVIGVVDLMRILDKSISFTFDYLITPRQTLLRFVLGGKQEVAVNLSLYSKLDLIIGYDYFPVLLGELLKRKGHEGILGNAEAEFAIANIDNLILRHATISTMIELLDPLYEFFNYRSRTPEIEKELLAAFFSEKGLNDIAQKFAEAKKPALSLHDAVDMLTGLLLQREVIHDDHQIISTEGEPDFHTINVPEYGRFLEDLKTAGVRLPLPPISEHSGLLPLEMFMSEKLKRRTLKRIFRYDKEVFEHFLLSMNNINDKGLALLNLETMINIQQSNAGSKTAANLRDALEMRFKGKEGNN